MANETAIDTRKAAAEAAIATATGEAPLVAPAPAWKAPPSWLPRTFHALAYRDFVFLWLGQITNSLGMWIDMVARPILVLMVTGSALQMGLIVAVRGIPMLFLQPIAGVAADRFDRRMVMLCIKSLSLLVNFAFAFIILSGQLELWHIYATAIAKSVLQAFDTPARNALLPSLVPPHLLINAIGLNSGSMQLVRTISGGIAGLSIALFAILGQRLSLGGEYFGMGATYMLAAVFYALAVALTYKLQVPPEGRVARSEENWVSSLVDGFRFAAQSQPILGVFVLLVVRSTFGMPYMSVFVPLIAMQVMDFGFLSTVGLADPERQGEVGLGLMLSVSGIGGVAGTFVIVTIGEGLRRKGLWILVAQLAFGAAMVALGLTSLLPAVVLPFLSVAALGLGQSIVMPVKNAVLLEQSPNEMRGRVLGLQGLDRGFASLGGMFSGFAAAAIGGPMALALFGVLCVVGTLAVGALCTGLRRVE